MSRSSGVLFAKTHTKKLKNKRKRQGTIKFVFGDPLTDFSVHGGGKLNSQGTLSDRNYHEHRQDCYDRYL